jgi:ketosteroid isomerase-like protein
MKKLLLPFVLLFSFTISAQTDKKAEIDKVLNAWHEAAAQANFDNYFSLLSKDAIFIGTDPTENWSKDAFIAFARPSFEKGEAWDFKPLERHIYFSDDGKIAWFDELLDTWMKICRGSGVLKKENGQWKIAHYVLSMTIPNDDTKEVIKIKAAYEDRLTEELKKK